MSSKVLDWKCYKLLSFHLMYLYNFAEETVMLSRHKCWRYIVPFSSTSLSHSVNLLSTHCQPKKQIAINYPSPAVLEPKRGQCCDQEQLAELNLGIVKAILIGRGKRFGQVTNTVIKFLLEGQLLSFLKVAGSLSVVLHFSLHHMTRNTIKVFFHL